MATKTEAVLIDHRKVAKMLGISTKMFRVYVARGVHPKPHHIAEPLWFYRVDSVQYFLKNEKWPDSLKFRARRAAR